MRITTRTLVISAVFLAITLLLGQIPFLGFVPMPWGINATTLQIPTILAGIIAGPIGGLLTGLGFGVTSFIRAGQPGGNIIFTDPLISILPRLFISPVAWAVYAALRRVNEPLAAVAGGAAGSLTNTILVVGMIILTGKLAPAVIIPIGAANGSGEAILSALVTLAVVAAWRGFAIGRRRGASV